MGRRHGIFECTVCKAQLMVKPGKGIKHRHDKLRAFAPKDHIGRWIYTSRDDSFVHQHYGMGLFKTEFVEDFEFEESAGGRQNDKSDPSGNRK